MKPEKSKKYTFHFEGGPASLMEDPVEYDEVIAKSKSKAYEIILNCYSPAEVARAKLIKVEKLTLYGDIVNPVGYVHDGQQIRTNGIGSDRGG
jgi:hypothetical protein